jgi:hypothetical protein
MNVINVPCMFQRSDALLPLSLDVIHDQGRYMEQVLWAMDSSLMSVDAFAFQICADQDFPSGLQYKIAHQMHQQIDSFKELLELFSNAPKGAMPRGPELLSVDICLMHGGLKYEDQFVFDQYDPYFSPEEFATTTVRDLGLPMTFTPLIAHHIRDCTYQALLNRVKIMTSMNVDQDREQEQEQLKTKAKLNKDEIVENTTSTIAISLEDVGTSIARIRAIVNKKRLETQNKIKYEIIHEDIMNNLHIWI